MRNKLVVFGFWILLFGFVWFLGFGIWSFSGEAGAMGGPVPKAEKVGLLIDDFEDGNLASSPFWWVFDQVSPEVVNDPLLQRDSSKYALLIKGESKNAWYAGGLGCYLAKQGQDLSNYRNLQLDIYGYGPGQGTLKIELFDDDNGNWDLEQNTLEAYAALYDDHYVHELLVDWVGWKRVVIPFADFQDINPGVGDDVWNPAQAGATGGLLQIQFICISSRKVGTLQFAADNLRLTK